MATNVIIAGGVLSGAGLPFVYSENNGFEPYDTLMFDAVTNVSVDLSNTITQHAVESKVDISDHVYSHNDKFEVTGVVTNTPVQNHFGNIIDYDVEVKRTQKAVDFLRALKESKAFFTLVTEFEIFDDVLMTSLRYNINAAEADQLVFTMAVERVRTVDSLSVTLVTDVSKTANGSTEQSGKAKEDGTENKTDGSSQKQTHRERTLDRVGSTVPGN